ncbi:MAG: hypothetical protein KF696_05255 [Planctomycetes bacterium]|nr:hypothetical protein [Planctomycetota bacterium]MCW8136293.1 hypothetical protein [Planctomycetota bacterium]
MATALPDEPETKALLTRWSALLDAHMAGKLMAGEVVLRSSQSKRDDWRSQLERAKAASGSGGS